MLNSRLPKKSTSKSNVFPERRFDPTFAIFRDFHEFFQGFSQLLFSTNFFVYKFEFSFQLVSASPRSPGSPLSQDILVSVLSFSGQSRAQQHLFLSKSLSPASKATKLGWTSAGQPLICHFSV